MTPADNLMRWFSKMSIRIRSGYRDHAFHLVGLAVLCSILAASVFVVVASLGRNGEQGAGTTASPRSAPGSPQTPGQRGALTFTNLSGGYAFTYPRTWTVEKKGAATELASPDGETVVSFGSGGTPQVGGGGGDHPGSQGLLRTLGTAVDPSVLETAWQQVAGERSLLVSGTADDPTGRSIRFLVIAIPGERPTNTISIAVAAHSAPSRMLPRLERIVASFDILDDESSTEEIALPQA